MFLGVDNSSLVNPVQLEKIVLAKKVGQFLAGDDSDGDRKVVENIARMLVQDTSREVREVLSFELRSCSELPTDLVDTIVHDIDDVAEPFLASTTLLDDPAFAELIPVLSEHLKGVVARRGDLGELTMNSLASHGEQESVSFLVRNDAIELPDKAAKEVLSRFHNNPLVMDQLSLRGGLPQEVADKLLDLVSDHCRKALEARYGVEKQVSEKLVASSRAGVLMDRINKMSPDQIRAFVMEQRNQNRLTHKMVLDMAGRGNRMFLESAVAVMSSRNIGEIREVFSLQDPKAFVAVMKEAGASKAEFEGYLEIAKANRTKLEKASD